MPDYIIVYLKEGSHIGSAPWSADLEKTKTAAREGLMRNGADELEIRSGNLYGALVWQEFRDAQRLMS